MRLNIVCCVRQALQGVLSLLPSHHFPESGIEGVLYCACKLTGREVEKPQKESDTQFKALDQQLFEKVKLFAIDSHC